MPQHQDKDQSTQESEYSDNESSDKDSLNNMSLVSSTEIQGLAKDLQTLEDDGYDTETTNNTSPSHKRHKSSPKAGAISQERITIFYAASYSFDGSNSSLPPTLRPIQFQQA